MDKITAPWSAQQVDALNDFQRGPWMHPFTCAQRDGHPLDPEGDHGVLVASRDGWTCRHCPYTQTWAWAVMAEPLPAAAGRQPATTPDQEDM